MSVIEEILIHKDIYYRYAYSILGNKEDAMDAIQDMYLVVYKDYEKLKDKEKLYSWSMGILTNCARTIYRKRKKYKLVTWFEEKGLEVHAHVDNEIDIEKALNSISNKQKECIILKYYIGHSLDEISDILSIPIGTVKSRIHNGLKKMETRLEGYHESTRTESL